MKTRFKKSIAILVVIGVGIGATVSWYYNKQIETPLFDSEQDFLVNRGDTLSSIANNLVDGGFLKEEFTLKAFARINAVDHIKAGEYLFPAGITLGEFVHWIEKGKGQIGIKLTIVEGWTFKQMREAISHAPKLIQKTAAMSGQEIMQAMGFPDRHPEGQFYPDTYQYRAGDSDLTLYKKSFNLMQEILNSAWENRKPDIQITDKYQALILASIVEKESQVWDEQPEISGVFENRLRLGMRLQTDPTVIYGVGDAYNGDITRKHLKTDTPYNTYTRGGLPPTPISLPGESAILASVNPAVTKSLYFVAKGKGRHKFSKTLKEHNAAVQKYIFNK
jgi:UPF0755 protein